MNKKIRWKVASLLLSTLSFPSCLQAISLQEDNIDQIIREMTLEEKVALLNGTGMEGENDGPTVGNVNTNDVDGSAGTTHAIPRLGIPAIVLADGPAGLRISPTRAGSEDTFYATAFPIASSIASSWDTKLAETVGQAIGNEGREYGVDLILAPALNLHKYPLAGRNFEYYSEDPLISGYMAGSLVKGIQSEGVGSTIKHFVANNHEWNRGKMDVQLDESVLRALYLKGFEIAVMHSDPWAVMSSYNKVNGEYTSESSWLLEEVLRGEWGFSGIVMTDWYAGANPVSQVIAGNDLLMPGQGWQIQAITGAAAGGAIPQALLDRNVKRVLQLIVKTPTFKQLTRSQKPDLKQHAQVARSAAADGMVLLENANNTLPLSSKVTSKLALFGNASYDFISGGNGSGDVSEAYTVSLEEGLSAKGYTLESSLASEYKTYVKEEKAKLPERHGIEAMMPEPKIAELVLSDKQINDAAKQAGAAIITLSRYSGEFVDRRAKEFPLTDNEKALLKQVAGAFHALDKPVVVVLNVGGVIETASLNQYADAVLLAWLPGQEAGHAVTDILNGNVNPSAKLTTTFARSLDSYPGAKQFPGVISDPEAKPDIMGTLPASIHYTDAMNVGYRFFSQHPEASVYPFGYGLSYTSFAATDFMVRAVDSGLITAKVKITNTGDKAGRHVVQLYAAGDSVPGTGIALAGFAKTAMLKPAQSEVVEIRLLASEFLSHLPSTGSLQIHLADHSEKITESKTIKF